MIEIYNLNAYFKIDLVALRNECDATEACQQVVMIKIYNSTSLRQDSRTFIIILKPFDCQILNELYFLICVHKCKLVNYWSHRYYIHIYTVNRTITWLTQN